MTNDKWMLGVLLQHLEDHHIEDNLVRAHFSKRAAPRFTRAGNLRANVTCTKTAATRNIVTRK